MKNSSGVTIIEMMVVVAIAGIVALVVTTAFADSIFVYNRQRAEERLAQKTRQSLNDMLENIRDGNEILLGSTASDITLLVPAIDCAGKVIKASDTSLHQPDSILTRDQFRYFIDNVDDVLDPSDADDPTNHKLKFILTPAANIPGVFPGSCRESIGTNYLPPPFPGDCCPITLANKVQNLLDAPAVALFQSIDPATGLPRIPTYGDQTIVVRLVLQDTYRGDIIRAEATTNITLRNWGL